MAKLKKIDTTQVPETLTAPWIKRFFKDYFGIPVNVRKANGPSWVSIWISPKQNPEDHGFTYECHFSEEFGNRCLRIVYPTSEKLCSQNWGGNIQQHSIAMLRNEFRQLLREIIAENAIARQQCLKAHEEGRSRPLQEFIDELKTGG